MCHHRSKSGVYPYLGAVVSQVRDKDGCHPHECPVAGRLWTALVPRQARLEIADELTDRGTDPEDSILTKLRCNTLGNKRLVLDQLLQRPKRQLRVV